MVDALRKVVILGHALLGIAFVPGPLRAEEVLQFIETDDLRLLYVYQATTYGMPNVGRRF